MDIEIIRDGSRHGGIVYNTGDVVEGCSKLAGNKLIVLGRGKEVRSAPRKKANKGRSGDSAGKPNDH